MNLTQSRRENEKSKYWDWLRQINHFLGELYNFINKDILGGHKRFIKFWILMKPFACISSRLFRKFGVDSCGFGL
jgi:hypothetical protein